MQESKNLARTRASPGFRRVDPFLVTRAAKGTLLLYPLPDDDRAVRPHTGPTAHHAHPHLFGVFLSFTRLHPSLFSSVACCCYRRRRIIRAPSASCPQLFHLATSLSLSLSVLHAQILAGVTHTRPRPPAGTSLESAFLLGDEEELVASLMALSLYYIFVLLIYIGRRRERSRFVLR